MAEEIKNIPEDGEPKPHIMTGDHELEYSGSTHLL